MYACGSSYLGAWEVKAAVSQDQPGWQNKILSQRKKKVQYIYQPNNFQPIRPNMPGDPLFKECIIKNLPSDKICLLSNGILIGQKNISSVSFVKPSPQQ